MYSVKWVSIGCFWWCTLKPLRSLSFAHTTIASNSGVILFAFFLLDSFRMFLVFLLGSFFLYVHAVSLFNSCRLQRYYPDAAFSRSFVRFFFSFASFLIHFHHFFFHFCLRNGSGYRTNARVIILFSVLICFGCMYTVHTLTLHPDIQTEPKRNENEAKCDPMKTEKIICIMANGSKTDVHEKTAFNKYLSDLVFVLLLFGFVLLLSQCSLFTCSYSVLIFFQWPFLFFSVVASFFLRSIAVAIFLYLCLCISPKTICMQRLWFEYRWQWIGQVWHPCHTNYRNNLLLSGL